MAAEQMTQDGAEFTNHGPEATRESPDRYAIQRRVDAADGVAYTWMEFRAFYSGLYTRQEIRRYWMQCRIVPIKYIAVGEEAPYLPCEQGDSGEGELHVAGRASADDVDVAAAKIYMGLSGREIELQVPTQSTVQEVVALLAEREGVSRAQLTLVVKRGGQSSVPDLQEHIGLFLDRSCELVAVRQQCPRLHMLSGGPTTVSQLASEMQRSFYMSNSLRYDNPSADFGWRLLGDFFRHGEQRWERSPRILKESDDRAIYALDAMDEVTPAVLATVRMLADLIDGIPLYDDDQGYVFVIPDSNASIVDTVAEALGVTFEAEKKMYLNRDATNNFPETFNVHAQDFDAHYAEFCVEDGRDLEDVRWRLQQATDLMEDFGDTYQLEFFGAITSPIVWLARSREGPGRPILGILGGVFEHPNQPPEQRRW